MDFCEKLEMFELFGRLECEEFHKHLSDYKYIYDRVSEAERQKWRDFAKDKWNKAKQEEFINA